MDIKDIYLQSQSHKIISLDRARDMLSHAYLIECADKFITQEFALMIAKDIYCNSDNTPCNHCISCSKIEHSNMVDLKIYPKEKNIMVDDIVEIVSDSIERPMDSDYKVYILRDFDSATIQAQNKILKTLEEPPHNVIFVLTCSNSGGVLPTILSRVKTITEPLLDLEIVREYLASNNIANAESVARVSGRNIHTALKLASSGDVDKIIDLAFDILMNLRSSADVLKYSSKIVALKKDFVYLIDTLITILRDVAIVEHIDLLNYNERTTELQSIARSYTCNAIETIVAKLCEIYNKLEFNCNLVGVVDQMLLNILEVKFLCQK